MSEDETRTVNRVSLRCKPFTVLRSMCVLVIVSPRAKRKKKYIYIILSCVVQYKRYHSNNVGGKMNMRGFMSDTP